MYAKGVASTTLDEVMAASGTSKSQLYYHFADKEALVRDIVSYRAAQVLARELQLLQRVDSLRGLQRWRQTVVHRVAMRHGAFGCELGSLASELSDRDGQVRSALAEHFASWESYLAGALERIRDRGELDELADPALLATGIMVALQGGYLLAQTARDARPMEIALDMALDHVRAHAKSS